MNHFSVTTHSITVPDFGRTFYFRGPRFPQRPVVVLLHGLSANHTTWLNFMHTLAELRINTIAPDLRGHGLSAKPRNKSWYGLDSISRDIDAIMIQEGIPVVSMVGYSWGGGVALDFATRRPESLQSLALVSTNHYNPWAYKWYRPFTPFVRFIVEGLGNCLQWQKRKEYYYFDQHRAMNYWRATFEGLQTMPISVNLWLLAGISRTDFRSKLSRIHCPTLLIGSKRDTFLTQQEIEEMSQKIPHSEVCFLDHASHFLASSHQDILSGHLLSFFEQTL